MSAHLWSRWGSYRVCQACAVYAGDRFAGASCSEHPSEDALNAYMHSRASLPERVIVLAHLEKCDHCRTLVADVTADQAAAELVAAAEGGR